DGKPHRKMAGKLTKKRVIGLMSGLTSRCLKASKRLVGKLIPDWKSIAGGLLRRKIVTWYLISRTVFGPVDRGDRPNREHEADGEHGAAEMDLGTNRTSSTVARQKEALTAPVSASHTTPASPPSPGGRRRRHRPRSGRSPSAPRASWARRRAQTWLRSPAAAPGGRRRQ